ncbi:MAG: M48 family metallopeptidase [Candidatus Moranbacteria bacterium]|nr:M48 family metallopeptidase [Candidatus Moranbacteria bacterium]
MDLCVLKTDKLLQKIKMDKRKININGKDIEYVFKRTKGSKSVKLAVYADGRFVVSAPKWYPMYIVKKFIEEKSQWIFERVKDIDFDLIGQKQKAESADYKKSVKLARAIIHARLEFFNCHYNFQYNRVAIKNQKTCWGSCSQKANLNFNYKIINLPDEMRDYVIVHELCHLQELNHSKRFWNLVSQTVPNYRTLRRKLTEIK